MIRSYYVICNGSPLYIHSDRGEEQTQALLSGFLSAFQTFASNLDKSRISKIELDTGSYFYAINKPILSVIETDNPEDELEARVFQIIAERLGRSFVEKYGDKNILNWCGDTEEYIDFKPTYDKIVEDASDLLKKSQKDFITEYFVEAASDENIIGVVVFDLEKDEIIASDIPHDFEEDDFEAFGSMLFAFIDRLGRQLKAGGINELIMRAKNYWIGGFRKESMAVFMIFTQDYFGTILPNFVKNFVD